MFVLGFYVTNQKHNYREKKTYGPKFISCKNLTMFCVHMHADPLKTHLKQNPLLLFVAHNTFDFN